MKSELIIFAITIFFILNTYSDGKYVKVVKSWKKYYQMAGIGFIGLSAYIFMRKYLPIDKDATDLLTPFLDMSKGSFAGSNPMYGMSPQEQRILNSGRVPSTGTCTGAGIKNVKRSVSETKKKYVAAQQGWNCGACKKQLPAWFEVDHKIRLDNGGSNNVDNLVALCRDCHGKKTAFENL